MFAVSTAFQCHDSLIKSEYLFGIDSLIKSEYLFGIEPNTFHHHDHLLKSERSLKIEPCPPHTHLNQLRISLRTY